MRTNETLRITAAGQENHRFANWIVDSQALVDNPLILKELERPLTIIAEFLPITSLDIDGDGATDVDTDGKLILRYLFGFTGPALTDGVVDTPSATRSQQQMVEYLDMIRAVGILDIDGNDEEDALTDGILVLRHIAGYGGSSLSNSAVDGSNCRCCDTGVVEHFLDAFTP